MDIGLPPTTVPSSRNAHRWISRYAVVFLILLGFTLPRIFYFSRKMAATSAASSSWKATGADATATVPEREHEHRRDDSVFYNTTWPKLEHVLCGEGAPNLMLSSTLFRLARAQVFSSGPKKKYAKQNGALVETFVPTRPIDLHTREFRSVSSEGPTETLTRFFAGDFGTSIFHGWNDATGDRFVTVYVKIWKCGNNQIRWMEKKLYKHYSNGTYSMMPLPQVLGDYLPSLYNHENSNNSKIMPPPCIYTAVRDPISHFLSGYNEVEVRQLGEYNEKIPRSDAEYAPYHVFVPYSSESHELRKRRFRAFVEDLLLEEPVFASHFVYSHFFSMSRVLAILAKYNTKLTGYIPELGNITQNWPEFMSTTCPNFPKRNEIPKMTKQGQHKSSNDRLGLYRAAKEVWAEAGPISEALCLLHAFDYACFRDLPDGIPTLCQSVYQDHAEEIVAFGTQHYLKYNPKKGKK